MPNLNTSPESNQTKTQIQSLLDRLNNQNLTREQYTQIRYEFKKPAQLLRGSKYNLFCSIFMTFLLLSLFLTKNLAFANDIKLNFREDKEFNRRYYLHVNNDQNQTESLSKLDRFIKYLKYFLHLDKETDEQKIYVAEYDLNDDGEKEYVIGIETDYRLCPMIGCAYTIGIYNKNFDELFYNNDGYNNIIRISSVKFNGYNNIILECLSSEKKYRQVIFNKVKKYYEIMYDYSDYCTLQDEQKHRVKKY